MEKSATLFRPKLIVAGASAYARLYDYARIRKVNALGFLTLSYSHSQHVSFFPLFSPCSCVKYAEIIIHVKWIL